METRILIKNLTAAKSGQVEEFAAARYRELTIGRDPSCDIKFDPDNDLVSRRHAKITQSPTNASEYTIADLGSRNGTFVNKQRILEPLPFRSATPCSWGRVDRNSCSRWTRRRLWRSKRRGLPM